MPTMLTPPTPFTPNRSLPDGTGASSPTAVTRRAAPLPRSDPWRCRDVAGGRLRVGLHDTEAPGRIGDMLWREGDIAEGTFDRGTTSQCRGDRLGVRHRPRLLHRLREKGWEVVVVHAEPLTGHDISPHLGLQIRCKCGERRR